MDDREADPTTDHISGTPTEAIIRASDGLVPAVANLLREMRYRREPITIALPSAWCFSASIDPSGLPKRSRHRAMMFRFEEKLPLPAEDVVADFVHSGNTALGVCANAQPLRALMTMLEEHGIRIGTICPAAFLASQYILSTHATTSVNAVIFEGGGRIDCLKLQDFKPIKWISVLEADQTGHANSLAIHIGSLVNQSDSSISAITCGLSKSALASIRSFENLNIVDSVTGSFNNAVALGAGDTDRARTVPWVNLRRDQLADADPHAIIKTPLVTSLVFIILLLVSLIAASQWRGYQYNQLTLNLEDQQRAEFRKVFPGRRVPVSVKIQMDAADRQLSGVSGSSSMVPPRPSALVAAYNLLARLPRDLRFRILDIRLDGKQLYLEGHARSHGDADRIAGALRAAQGFDINPPRTEKLPDKGVGFTLTGSYKPADTAAAGATSKTAGTSAAAYPTEQRIIRR